jgi:uncharacterized membrane protein
MTIRKTSAWIILILLIVIPFIDWRLGAVIWLCAWIIYILQMLFSKFQGQPPDDSDGDGEG